MSFVRVVPAALAMLVFGCDTDSPPANESAASGGSTSTASTSTGTPIELEGTHPLIDLAAFEKTTRAEDPFDGRPADVQCEFGYGLEDGFFEIETDLCNYGAFSQPILAPIRIGDTLDFLLLHENLTSTDPDAQAHVGIAIGTEIVFETTIDIPTEASFIGPQWVSTLDAPEGTPVHIHVHNHGINSYRVSSLTVTYAE